MLLLNNSEMTVPKAQEPLAPLEDQPVAMLSDSENVLCVHVHGCVGARTHTRMQAQRVPPQQCCPP